MLACNVVESPAQIVVLVAVMVGTPPLKTKCAMMLSDLTKLIDTAESVVLGSGI